MSSTDFTMEAALSEFKLVSRIWQFRRLDESEVTIDTMPLYIDNPGLILAAIVRIIDESCAVLASSAA